MLIRRRKNVSKEEEKGKMDLTWRMNTRKFSSAILVEILSNLSERSTSSALALFDIDSDDLDLDVPNEKELHIPFDRGENLGFNDFSRRLGIVTGILEKCASLYDQRRFRLISLAATA